MEDTRRAVGHVQLPTGDQAIEGYNLRLQKIVTREQTLTSWGNLLQALRDEAEYWASLASNHDALERMSREKQQKMNGRATRVRERGEEFVDSEEEITIKKQRLDEPPALLEGPPETAASAPTAPVPVPNQTRWEQLYATLTPEQRASFASGGQSPCRRCGREARYVNGRIQAGGVLVARRHPGQVAELVLLGRVELGLLVLDPHLRGGTLGDAGGDMPANRQPLHRRLRR